MWDRDEIVGFGRKDGVDGGEERCRRFRGGGGFLGEGGSETLDDIAWGDENGIEKIIKLGRGWGKRKNGEGGE